MNRYHTHANAHATSVRADEAHVNSRWMIALAGTVIMTSLGAIYSWSIFTQPLIAGFGWSNTTVTWTFAVAILALSVGALVGGRWQDRAGPRLVTLIGVLLWGIGNVLAGLGTPRFGAVWLYLTYGALGRFGVGMAYITPVAVVTKWFPDRRGLGSGMVVMGFGLGAFFYNFIVKSSPGFEAAIVAATDYAESVRIRRAVLTLSLDHLHALMNVFVWSGIAFIAVGGACALFLKNPPHGYASPGLAAHAPEARSHTTREMLCRPQFYLLWSMLFLNITAGILVISNAVPIMQELTHAAPTIVAAMYGCVCAANGIGRLFWGAVSDRIGRHRAYCAIFGIQACVFIALGSMESLTAVVLAYSIILLCYGGGFGTMPSFNADYFGTRHLGANYGALLTAWGAAGLVGPLFAAAVKDATGSFSGALPIVTIMLCGAMILPMVIKRPGEAHPVATSLSLKKKPA
ncbi:MAG: OFA family MFS transporter [Burkholderiales bacterium]